jgi:hypothetical protein
MKVRRPPQQGVTPKRVKARQNRAFIAWDNS